MELKAENIPVLVSFSDPSEPESMERVLPLKFTEFFGPGYSLRSIWVKKNKQ
ncbi:conserved protein of unknown function [Pseudodesulfovibrio profundus]|uniref:Uncharacterized protein n=1 Tax=Pseudodesulfovibrio profundus TaxID=57320 RepID=A0A2C8FBR1_9BACT|nr:conserved protein of unknown function [Pseudodesulfovibrio profundus]